MLGRTGEQTKKTERLHKRDGTHWPTGRNHTDWIYMYLRTENKDRRTKWMDRQTDELDERTGWTDNLTNGLMNWKEGPCGRPNRLDGRTDGRTNRRNRQTKQTGGTDQTDWMEGQMHKTNGLKEQTRKHIERMHALDKRPDGRTDWRNELNWTILEFGFVWSQVLCRSRSFRLFSVSLNNR